MRCDNPECDLEFHQATPWQRFCSVKCRNHVHNGDRRRQQIEAAEEAREDARQDRLNGLTDEPEQGLTLASLGIQPAEAKPMSRPVRRL
jgi:hypothetical protein